MDLCLVSLDQEGLLEFSRTTLSGVLPFDKQAPEPAWLVDLVLDLVLNLRSGDCP